MPTKTRTFRVVLQVDVEAHDMVEAAHNAMLILHGPTAPTKFSVAEKRRVDGQFVEIDLSEEN